MDLSGLKTNENLVLLDQTFASAEEVIDALARLAKSEGFVTNLFIEKIKEREKEYPTGLKMAKGIAIPHIEDGCLQSFVSVATLKTPVTFQSMDGSSDDVGADMVFLFGITNPREQVEVLKKFAQTFAEEEALEQLADSAHPKELLEKLNKLLGGFLILD